MAIQETSGVIEGVDGSAAAPEFTFTADLDTGLFRPAVNTLAITTGGISRVTVSVALIISTLPYVAPAGALATPSYVFAGDLDTGMWSPAANTVNFSAGAVLTLTMTSVSSRFLGVVLGVAGSVGAPAFSFFGDPDTGIINSAADSFAIVTGGVTRVTVSTTTVLSTLVVQGPAGAAAAPTFTFSADTNTGMYGVAPDILLFATGGVERVRFDAVGRVGINVIPASPARLALKDHVAFPGSEGSFTTAGNTITTATVGSLVLFEMTLADNTLYWFEAMIIGRDIAGVQRMFYVRWVRAHRQGGGAATLGTIFTPATDETTAVGFDGTFATDGANAIRVLVTQTGALTVNWCCTVRYQSISIA